MRCPCQDKNNAAAVAVGNAPVSTEGVPIVGTGIGPSLVQAADRSFVLWPMKVRYVPAAYAQAVVAAGKARIATQQEIDNFEVV